MMLPEDVTREILSRIPATSLLRLKCVSKSWRSIISDPTFIWKHHETVSRMRNAEVVMMSRRSNATNRRVLSLLRSGSGGGAVEDQDLPTFLNETFGHVRLVGPCKGIVCLYGYPDNIGLWNPTTRCFKKLPASAVPRPANSKLLGADIGLAFNSKTRDMKVLQILCCAQSQRGDCNTNAQIVVYQVEIYSGRENSWKKVEGAVPLPAKTMCYSSSWSLVYRDETFCWWAQEKDTNAEVILSFNVIDEVFEVMTELPSADCIGALGGQYSTTRAILGLKQSLALVVYRQKEVEKVFDVWIFNKEAKAKAKAKESDENKYWTKLMSIGPISGVERVLGFWNNNNSKEGDECVVILEGSRGEMVLYNCVSRKLNNLGIYGKRTRLEVLVLTQSLFPLSSSSSSSSSSCI